MVDKRARKNKDDEPPALHQSLYSAQYGRDYDNGNDDNDDQDIPTLDEREPPSFVIPDFVEQQISLPTLEDLEKEGLPEYETLNKKPSQNDNRPSIDLSILTQHLSPPECVGAYEDEVWDVDRLIIEVQKSLSLQSTMS